MALFKKTDFSDLSTISFDEVKGRDEFTPELFENEILFLDIKCIPYSNQISHYLLFGMPDSPLKMRSLKEIIVYVQNIDLGDKATFERLFQKWFMDASHTLVMFDSLDILPKVVQNLNISSFACTIFDLSVLLRLGRNGLPKNSKFIWELLQDGFEEDVKNLNFLKLENKFTQFQQQKNSQNWTQMEHNKENVQLLADEGLKVGLYLTGYALQTSKRNYWYKSFSLTKVQSIEIYYLFFEPLFEPFVF